MSQSFGITTPLPNNQTMEFTNTHMERNTDPTLDLFEILDGTSLAPVVPTSDPLSLSPAEYFHSGLWLFDSLATPPHP